MVKLRKLLTDSRKIRRGRRIFLTMNITIMSWITESFGSIIFMLMGYYPDENRTTRGLQCILGFTYMIVIPCSYLLNSSDVKKMIIDNRIYLAFINKFFPHIHQLRPEHRNQDQGLQHQENWMVSNYEFVWMNKRKTHLRSFGKDNFFNSYLSIRLSDFIWLCIRYMLFDIIEINMAVFNYIQFGNFFLYELGVVGKK